MRRNEPKFELAWRHQFSLKTVCVSLAAWMASSAPLRAALLCLLLLLHHIAIAGFAFTGSIVKNVRQRYASAHAASKHAARALQLPVIAAESLPDDLDEWEWIDDDDEDENEIETDAEAASDELLSLEHDANDNSDYGNELEAALDLSNAAAARVSAATIEHSHVHASFVTALLRLLHLLNV
jgi:hypothetical protein